MTHGYQRTGVVSQEEQRDPLNDTNQSQLDVDDHGIEFPTGFLGAIHRSIGSRSVIKLSRALRAEHCEACSEFPSAPRNFVSTADVFPICVRQIRPALMCEYSAGSRVIC